MADGRVELAAYRETPSAADRRRRHGFDNTDRIGAERDAREFGGYRPYRSSDLGRPDDRRQASSNSGLYSLPPKFQQDDESDHAGCKPARRRGKRGSTDRGAV